MNQFKYSVYLIDDSCPSERFWWKW